MRITYEQDSDAATIYILDEIGPGGAPRSEPCELETPGAAVILLLSAAGQLVGVEVLGASKLLPSQVLAAATTFEPTH